MFLPLKYSWFEGCHSLVRGGRDRARPMSDAFRPVRDGCAAHAP
ncbi:hypothetical protein STXM2123_1615 [Streptomyces sp. F-3]|nr:hypothetical protein STXM2123_1615 [Streptomyces sp. F-3]